MPALPIRKNNHSRALLAYDSRNLQSILPRIFHPAIGNIECLPKADLQDSSSFVCLASPVLGCATSAHISLREVQDSGAVALLRHLEQSAAAGLFYVVAMGGNGKNIQCRSIHVVQCK